MSDRFDESGSSCAIDGLAILCKKVTAGESFEPNRDEVLALVELISMGEASRADMDGSDSGATLWAAIVKVAESLSLGQYFENDQQDYSNIPVHISRFIGALLSSFEVILELVPDRIDSLLSDLRTVFLTSKTTSQHDDRIVQLLKEYKDLFPYSYMFSRRSGKYPKPSFDAVNRYLRTSNSLNSHSMGSEEDDTFKDEGDDDTLGDSFPAEAFPSVLAPSLMPLKPFAHSPYDQEKASNPTRDYADAVQLSPTQQLLQHPKHQQLGRLNTLSTKEDGEDDMAFVPDEASILDSYYNNFNRPQVEEDEEDSDEDHPYFVHRKPIRRVTRMKNQQSRNASSQRTKKLTRRRPSDDSTNGPDNNTAEGDDEVSNGGMPVSSLLRLSTKTVTFASKPDYQEAQPQSPSDDNSRLGSDIEVVPLEEMSSDSVHAFDLLDNEQNDNEESASKYHDTSTTTGSTNNIQRKGSVRTSPANTEPTSILRKSSTSNNNSSNSNPAFLSPITASRSTRDESPTPSPPRHDDSSLELSDGEGGHHKHQQHKGHLSRQKDRYDVNEDTDLNSIHDNMRGYGETNKPKSTSSDPWVTAGSSYNSSSKNSDQSTSSSRSTVDRQAPLGRYKNPLDASLEEEAWYRQQQQKLSPEQRDYPSDPHANRRARYSAQDDNETHENNEEDGDREQHGRSNRRDRSQDRVRGGTWLLPERKKFAYEENYEEYLQHKEYEHDGKGNDGKSWPPHSAHSPISHGNDNRNSSPPRAKTSDKNAGKDAKKTLKENLLKFKQRKELERQQRTHQHHVQRSSKYFEPTFLTKSRQTEHAGQQQVAETDLGSKEEAHEDEEEEVIVDVVKEGPALLESGAIRRSLEGWQNKYTRPTALLQAWEAQFTSTSSNINGNNTTANQLNSPSSVSPGHEQVGNVNSSLDYLPPPRRTSSVRLPSQSDYRQQQQQSYVQQSLPSPNYARDSAEVLLRSADSQNQQPGLLYQSTTSSIGVFDRPFQELPPNVIIPPLSEYATLTGVILEGALLKKSTKNFINRWQNRYFVLQEASTCYCVLSIYAKSMDSAWGRLPVTLKARIPLLDIASVDAVRGTKSAHAAREFTITFVTKPPAQSTVTKKGFFGRMFASGSNNNSNSNSRNNSRAPSPAPPDRTASGAANNHNNRASLTASALAQHQQQPSVHRQSSLQEPNTHYEVASSDGGHSSVHSGASSDGYYGQVVKEIVLQAESAEARLLWVVLLNKALRVAREMEQQLEAQQLASEY